MTSPAGSKVNLLMLSALVKYPPRPWQGRIFPPAPARPTHPAAEEAQAFSRPFFHRHVPPEIFKMCEEEAKKRHYAHAACAPMMRSKPGWNAMESGMVQSSDPGFRFAAYELRLRRRDPGPRLAGPAARLRRPACPRAPDSHPPECQGQPLRSSSASPLPWCGSTANGTAPKLPDNPESAENPLRRRPAED